MTITAQRELAKYIDDVLENVAWAETGEEAAQQIAGELGWRPPPRILSGDPNDIEAALEAMPRGAALAPVDAPEVLIARGNAISHSGLVWRVTGESKPYSSAQIAREWEQLAVLR